MENKVLLIGALVGGFLLLRSPQIQAGGGGQLLLLGGERPQEVTLNGGAKKSTSPPVVNIYESELPTPDFMGAETKKGARVWTGSTGWTSAEPSGITATVKAPEGITKLKGMKIEEITGKVIPIIKEVQKPTGFLKWIASPLKNLFSPLVSIKPIGINI